MPSDTLFSQWESLRSRIDGTSMKRRGRTIHLSDGVWQFKLGSSGVVLWDPQDFKRIIPWNVFLRWGNDEVERAHWKQYWPGLGPGDVKKWVKTHNLAELCSGSRMEQVPEMVPGKEHREFRPDQLICPVCGETQVPVCWAYPDHYPLVQGAKTAPHGS